MPSSVRCRPWLAAFLENSFTQRYKCQPCSWAETDLPDNQRGDGPGNEVLPGSWTVEVSSDFRGVFHVFEVFVIATAA